MSQHQNGKPWKLHYRQYRSMKGTKRLQLHVTDDTLVFLSTVTNDRGEPIGYGAAIDSIVEELQKLRLLLESVPRGTDL